MATVSIGLLIAFGCRSAPANSARAELEKLKVPFTAAEFAKQVAENQYKYGQLFLDAGMSPDTRSPEGEPVISLIKHPMGKRFLESLIKAGANVNATDTEGNTALMREVRLPPLAEILLQNGASPAPKNREGLTALHLAVLATTTETVKMLAKAGADVNERNAQGQTPLIMAVLNCALCVPVLLKEGADPNLTTDDRYSPLMYAAKAGNPTLMRTLLKAGADPNFIGADGATAFSLAPGTLSQGMLRGAGAVDAVTPAEEEEP